MARHEICACIDGDSVAKDDWLENVTAPLDSSKTVATGGTVRFKDDLFGNLASFWFFDAGKFLPWRHFYFWGANFACKKSSYWRLGGLEPFVRIRFELGLHFWAEDCYLSLALEKDGDVSHVPGAIVTAYPGAAANSIDRGRKQESDRKTLFRHFGI